MRKQRNCKPCTLLVGMWHGTVITENRMVVSQKIKNRITYDPAIPLLGIHSKGLQFEPQRYLYTHVCSNIIHNS